MAASENESLNETRTRSYACVCHVFSFEVMGIESPIGYLLG